MRRPALRPKRGCDLCLCICLHPGTDSVSNIRVADALKSSATGRTVANVAQSVEQRFRKARVVSSILTVGSSFNYLCN